LFGSSQRRGGGKAPPSVCIVGGPESAVAIAGVMGVDPGSAEPLVPSTIAWVDTAPPTSTTTTGPHLRRLANFYGGKRVCSVGCLGMGDCIRSCKFDAIHMGPDGFPVVDEAKCVGCGACETACPKNILTVRTMSQRLLTFNEEDGALAPCQQTCPAEINIPIHRLHPQGRLCRCGQYHPGAQSLAADLRPSLSPSLRKLLPTWHRGRAVSINQLKRFVADWEMNSGSACRSPAHPTPAKRLPSSAAGPAGVSCAYFLRRVGHSPTIFEAMPKLGGITRYGIPEYRLPTKSWTGSSKALSILALTYTTTTVWGKISPSNPCVKKVSKPSLWVSEPGKTLPCVYPTKMPKGVWQGINFLSSVASDPAKEYTGG
jgi:formate dehydrogenase beta subunit